MKLISFYLFCLAIVFFVLSACATTKPEGMDQPLTVANLTQRQEEITEDKEPDVLEAPGLDERWGIRILGIRQSANGYMLDFRYQVLDPEKASLLMNRKEKPFLIDQTSGAKFIVPNMPKVGPLRQTSLKPLAGRHYFILFANPGKFVKSGNKVTVVIGDFREENLVVE
jgi:hypothetical protein